MNIVWEATCTVGFRGAAEALTERVQDVEEGGGGNFQYFKNEPHFTCFKARLNRFNCFQYFKSFSSKKSGFLSLPIIETLIFKHKKE